MSNLKEQFNKQIRKDLKTKLQLKNNFQVPEIKKIVINAGLGEAKDSKEVLEDAISAIGQISGQKPRVNKSKKSIAGFKLREGQIVGASVTLRGQRMYDFLEKLVKISLPAIRDFRGLSSKSFDQFGNFSLGISDHTIFPEIKYDNAKNPISMQVNVNITAKDQNEGKVLLEAFGFPFEKRASVPNLNSGEENG
ncbi:50S ribosomal protein L5 [Candidatus Berkelbacteria bacterium CG08_land_8_20_14_0_20_39_8]|uniref:Large ribosomal subunit protein uL5 n=1 Tax=Candidatus Berkelbacteria bacterium CG08_land_8_20_14_0_20_39_8 TaxID=1974511 RepID=A0A2M6YC93_9BACT|nr:MAG: 50S ribosomal protein L5 [Candidatus Berkelbacteria bacterium CG08_land_8_20_14_0_20_39_8]